MSYVQSLTIRPQKQETDAEVVEHPEWKLRRVISGHTGWVRCLAVDPSNQWFASGSADRTIKIWDLAAGTLKLTLTGHVSTVRAMAISDRHPYLFSAGEDRQIKCWDLETNRVVRHYHGHLHGVYSLSLHPSLDILVTGSRDASVRVWDMRSRQPIHCLTGHRETVSSLVCNDCDPMIISGSHDTTIRFWDLAAGKTMNELTHHKKAVRALCMSPNAEDDFTLVSGAADRLRHFGLPTGQLIKTLDPLSLDHDTIVNSLAVNQDGVLFVGGDDGSMGWYDWNTGHCFQRQQAIPQPGSLEMEAGIFGAAFDRTGMRLLTAEMDKTIKVWGEIEE